MVVTVETVRLADPTAVEEWAVADPRIAEVRQVASAGRGKMADPTAVEWAVVGPRTVVEKMVALADPEMAIGFLAVGEQRAVVDPRIVVEKMVALADLGKVADPIAAQRAGILVDLGKRAGSLAVAPEMATGSLLVGPRYCWSALVYSLPLHVRRVRGGRCEYGARHRVLPALLPAPQSNHPDNATDH